MLRRIAPLAALAAVAVPATAHAGSTQYVGDPVTYLVQGKPATALTTVFRMNVPLPSGAQVTAQTAGGDVLATAAATAFGTSGLCYQAKLTLSSPVAGGATVDVVLSGGGLSLQPNPELVRLYTARRARVPANLIGGGC